MGFAGVDATHGWGPVRIQMSASSGTCWGRCALLWGLNADATASGAWCCVPVAGLSGIDATSGIAGLRAACHRLSGIDATSGTAGLSSVCHRLSGTDATSGIAGLRAACHQWDVLAMGHTPHHSFLG